MECVWAVSRAFLWVRLLHEWHSTARRLAGLSDPPRRWTKNLARSTISRGTSRVSNNKTGAPRRQARLLPRDPRDAHCPHSARRVLRHNHQWSGARGVLAETDPAGSTSAPISPPSIFASPPFCAAPLASTASPSPFFGSVGASTTTWPALSSTSLSAVSSCRPACGCCGRSHSGRRSTRPGPPFQRLRGSGPCCCAEHQCARGGGPPPDPVAQLRTPQVRYQPAAARPPSLAGLGRSATVLMLKCASRRRRALAHDAFVGIYATPEGPLNGRRLPGDLDLEVEYCADLPGKPGFNQSEVEDFSRVCASPRCGCKAPEAPAPSFASPQLQCKTSLGWQRATSRQRWAKLGIDSDMARCWRSSAVHSC